MKTAYDILPEEWESDDEIVKHLKIVIAELDEIKKCVTIYNENTKHSDNCAR